ncbi:MAG: cobalamin-dependent protein, partial [candidate division Zixibacteria bacterium]|nr:cobalamin-dependent protein [candidate division Zixibacteria bacterium]
MPIGLAYLGGSIKQHQHIVNILDSMAFQEDNHVVLSPSREEEFLIKTRPFISHLFHIGASWERIRRDIEELKPDLVGISCLTIAHATEAFSVARIAKSVDAKIPIVLGGGFPSALPTVALSSPYVDYLVFGEGEKTILELIQAIEGRLNHEAVEGLAYKIRGKIKINPRCGFINDLDQLPPPELRLLPLERWFRNTGRRFTMLITSRGCPFKCSFCS